MNDGLGGVLALDNQHRDAVDEKHHVLARTVAAIVDVELLGHLVHVAPLAARTRKVAVINVNELKVPLAVFLGAEELALVARISEKIRAAPVVRNAA